MGIEGKKKKTGKTARALMLGAELLAAGGAINAARDHEHETVQNRIEQPFKDFRRSESVSDRYGQTEESIVLGQKYAELEPELPINDEVLHSSLASDAGINQIEKSPLQIMRERKARAEANAAKLSKKAHENWKREQTKKSGR